MGRRNDFVVVDESEAQGFLGLCVFGTPWVDAPLPEGKIEQHVDGRFSFNDPDQAITSGVIDVEISGYVPFFGDLADQTLFLHVDYTNTNIGF